MSEETPTEPPSPLEVKKRLPFEHKEAVRGPGFYAAAAIYVAAALMMGAACLYFAFVQHRPLASVPVIAPGLGAIYFLIRAAMMLRPKIRG